MAREFIARRYVQQFFRAARPLAEETLQAFERSSRIAWRNVRRHPLVHACAIGMIALCVTLLATLDLGVHNLTTIGDGFQKEAQLTVYLVDGIAAERMHQITDAMTKLPGAEHVQLVTPQEAYARLRQSLGPQQQLLEGVEEAFLPASIEVKFRAGVADVFQLHPAYEKLQHLAGVEAVEWSGDWLSRLIMVREVLSRASLALRLTFVLATLLVVMGIVRLGLQKRSVELHAMRTIGATTTQLRLPFVCEGVGQGLLAAIVSLLMLFVIYRVAVPHLEPLLSTFLIAGRLHFLSLGYVLLLLMMGAIIGGAANLLAVGKVARS